MAFKIVVVYFITIFLVASLTARIIDELKREDRKIIISVCLKSCPEKPTYFDQVIK